MSVQVDIIFLIISSSVFISCSKLSLEKSQSVRQALSGHITDALQHRPSLIIFDDLDAIVSPPDSEGSQISNSIIALVDFLADIMDEYAVTNMPCLKVFRRKCLRFVLQAAILLFVM